MSRRTKAPGPNPQVESPPAEQKHSVPLIRPADSPAVDESGLAQEIAIQPGPATNHEGKESRLSSYEATLANLMGDDYVPPTSRTGQDHHGDQQGPECNPAQEEATPIPSTEAPEQTDEQSGKVALPELAKNPSKETGKAALPDLKEEGYEPGEEDLDEAEEESDADTIFTGKDHTDFTRLEARVLEGQRQAFTALRESRLRKAPRILQRRRSRTMPLDRPRISAQPARHVGSIRKRVLCDGRIDR